MELPVWKVHPWDGEDLSLKIDERDQTIWIYIVELSLFHSSQMKLKLAGLFFQKSTRWRWGESKMHQIKKPTALLLQKLFDAMHFRLCPAPSGGFLKKEPRQF